MPFYPSGPAGRWDSPLSQVLACTRKLGKLDMQNDIGRYRLFLYPRRAGGRAFGRRGVGRQRRKV